MFRASLLLLGLLVALTSNAQNPEFQVINQFSGLGVNVLHNHAGNLFVGSDKGLAKLQDGEMQWWTSTDEGEMFSVHSICADRTGTMWMGGDSSNVLMLPSGAKPSEVFRADSTVLPQAVIELETGINKIWMGGNKGMIIHAYHNTFEWEQVESVFEGNVNSFLLRGDELELVGRDNGLFFNKRNEEKWRLFKELEGCYEIKKKGKTYWLVGRNKERRYIVLKTDDLTVGWDELDIGCIGNLNKNKINDFAFDKNDRLWLATNYGLIRYDMNELDCKFFNTKKYADMPMKKVEHIAVMNDSVLYAANKKEGLVRITLKGDEEDELVLRKNLNSIDDIKCNDTLSLNKILFQTSSSEFLDGQAAKETLSLIVTYLEANPNDVIELYGHTDNLIDNKEYLLELSQSRVNRVKKFLTANGIKKNRIAAIAFGGEKPLFKGGTKEERVKNRRVEVLVKCN